MSYYVCHEMSMMRIPEAEFIIRERDAIKFSFYFKGWGWNSVWVMCLFLTVGHDQGKSKPQEPLKIKCGFSQGMNTSCTIILATVPTLLPLTDSPTDYQGRTDDENILSLSLPSKTGYKLFPLFPCLLPPSSTPRQQRQLDGQSL